MTLTVPEIPDISHELFTKFNKIKFHDDIHKYYLGDKNLISVTTKLHQYQDEFETYYWAERKAPELGLSTLEVINFWKALNDKSKLKGSAVHNYAELLFNNKIYKYDDDAVLAKLGKENIDILARMQEKTIKEEFEIVKTYVDKFYNDCYDKLIPIKTEYVVYDELWGLAGMMDIIFWNVKKKCFQIWDWKTNKELNMTSKYKKMLKFPLSLDDCEYNIYCLQLSSYKAIIERNTNIKIDGMFLVWLNEVNPSYQIIECQDFTSDVNMIMSGAF